MEPIRSGTTTERIVRTSILTAVLVLYALWCFKDAYYTYPQKNMERLVENLQTRPDPANYPPTDPRVTLAQIQRIRDSIERGKIPQEAELADLLGPPVVREGDTDFYFGPAGAARVVMKDGVVKKIAWLKGEKSDGDLFMQKVMGVAVGALALLMLIQWVRVVTTRAELTEDGLRVNSQGGLRFGGSPLVPFDAMTGLGSQDFKKKGWVEVEYSLADGRQGKVSLNDYVHRAFPDIVNEICNRRGFDNPLAKDEEAEDETGPAGGDGEAAGGQAAAVEGSDDHQGEV